MSGIKRWVLFGLVVGVTVTLATAKLWSAASLWTTPYAPTRLAWLALTLQANDGAECLRASPADYCIGTAYQAHAVDEIWVLVETRGQVPLEDWDSRLRTAKELVRLGAKNMGLPAPVIKVLRKSDRGAYAPLP
jgi:hypothetical protein